MIAALLQAGYRLAGTGDPRLARGLRIAVLEGLFSAAPHVLLFLLLRSLLSGTADLARILWVAAGMLVCLGARIAAGIYGTPQIFSGAYAMMSEGRIRLADHLRRLPMGWFGHARTGDIAARLTVDLELVEHLWSHFLGVMTAGLAAIGFLWCCLLWLDWRLGLAVLASLPIAMLSLWWGQRLATRYGKRLLAAASTAQAELHDYVHGIAVIRSFGRTGEAWRRLEQALQAHHREMLRIEIKPTPWITGFNALTEMGFALVVMLAAYLLVAGRLDSQTLLAFAVISLPLYRQLQEVGIATLLLRFGQRALERIESLLEEQPLPEPLTPRPFHGSQIELDNVRFAYSKDQPPALDGVSCTLPAGTMTAIVGPSGSGKSTLVHLIARLWDVDSGAVRVGRADVRDVGTEALQARIAMVFQDVVLFSGTVFDNLRVGRPDTTREAVITAARRAGAHEFIERLPQGYDTVLHEGGASLSGGERQRLSIARALLKDAPILLLDEATASVDPSCESQIQQALSFLARDRTVVVIAHRLRSVCHADRIIVLDRGRLVEQGRHQELLAKGGIYARLWSRQEQALQWHLDTHPRRASILPRAQGIVARE